MKVEGTLEIGRRTAAEEFVRSRGGSARWRISSRAARTYALLELPAHERLGDEAALRGMTVYDSPVIALAVYPSVAQALPFLHDALAGDGRPAGVRSCEPCDGGIVVEWDLDRTPAAVVLGAVDVELRRFNSGRTAELLTPLPAPWLAKIAADALHAPGVGAGRVLEDLVEAAGLGAL